MSDDVWKGLAIGFATGVCITVFSIIGLVLHLQKGDNEEDDQAQGTKPRNDSDTVRKV